MPEAPSQLPAEIREAVTRLKQLNKENARLLRAIRDAQTPEDALENLNAAMLNQALLTAQCGHLDMLVATASLPMIAVIAREPSARPLQPPRIDLGKLMEAEMIPLPGFEQRTRTAYEASLRAAGDDTFNETDKP